MLLKDKVAIVTGAGSGIGQGIAMRFATEGAKVVVAELDQRKGAATAAQIAETTSSEALAVPTNVARLQDVDAMVTKTLERFGRIDVLVNNAGIRFASPIVEMSDEEWHNTLATTPPRVLRSGSGLVLSFLGRDLRLGEHSSDPPHACVSLIPRQAAMANVKRLARKEKTAVLVWLKIYLIRLLPFPAAESTAQRCKNAHRVISR